MFRGSVYFHYFIPTYFIPTIVILLNSIGVLATFLLREKGNTLVKPSQILNINTMAGESGILMSVSFWLLYKLILENLAWRKSVYNSVTEYSFI